MTTPKNDWQHPCGTRQRDHLQHVHLFASNVHATINFCRTSCGTLASGVMAHRDPPFHPPDIFTLGA
jgi:hypothetical protein